MSPVKIAGVEEHFVIPGLLQACGKLPPDRRDLAFRPRPNATPASSRARMSG
jgi:hypothetical protein